MKTFNLAVALLLITPVLSLQAADFAVNCDKKTLTKTIEKLDKLQANTVSISGDCNEDIVISGHIDLTLIGDGSASITATGHLPEDPENSTETALSVEKSQITVETLTINGGFDGVACNARSNCVLRDVTVQDGRNGVTAQTQTTMDILGSSVIQNNFRIGLGVYGASSVNMRPDPPDSAGPVISGNGSVGAWVQDGSFLRADNVLISGNGHGVFAHRDALLKLFSNGSGLGVSDNLGLGVYLISSSSAQLNSPITNNGATGVVVGPLSFADINADISGNVGEVFCEHHTSVSQPSHWCEP
jgi:hypothetical protein